MRPKVNGCSPELGVSSESRGRESGGCKQMTDGECNWMDTLFLKEITSEFVAPIRKRQMFSIV